MLLGVPALLVACSSADSSSGATVVITTPDGSATEPEPESPDSGSSDGESPDVGAPDVSPPAPTCTDGVKNGDEIDVDCGDACPKCPNGKACLDANDCTGGICKDGRCRSASCSDGVKNGDETDVDCGGADCARCGTGGACNVDDDCTSGLCKSGVCKPPPSPPPPPPEPTCTDGSKNGDEADVDCGGSCSPCGLGKACRAANDCTSGDCEKGICVCPADKTTCGNSCVDTCSDNANCGVCGKACASNQACTSTACVGVGLWSFAATWSRDGVADLVVKTPNGNLVDPQNRGPDASTDFGQMDRVVTLDQNAGKGPENVFWDFDHTPPAGTYLVCVKPISFDGQSGEAGTLSSPIDITVVVKKGGEVNTTLRRTFTSFVSADGCSEDAPTFLGSVSFPAPRRR